MVEQDLALARRCADGDEAAWEQFVREFRPVLYRAADALDPSGGARDLADELYADLYGIARGGERRSLLTYYQGRSSLATWLRAVLSQRYVDRLRASRRLVPLPDDESAPAVADPEPNEAPGRRERSRIVQDALTDAIARLSPRDRLRLACYYGQALTLAETGRVLHEHEATASRQLARTRRALRAAVEHQLRTELGFTEAQIEECFEAAAADPGSFDLDRLLAPAERKESAAGRSG